jgi:large subunit ribosomal protein L32
MAVPRHSHTRSKTGKHRMHLFIEPVLLQSCKKCGKPVLPHTICKNCGFYKGRQVINLFSKLSKKDKKAREKDMKQKEKESKTESLTLEGLSKK